MPHVNRMAILTALTALSTTLMGCGSALSEEEMVMEDEAAIKGRALELPAAHKLIAWAALPSTERTPGPTSGQFTTPANGVVPPYVGVQPVPGWSGLLYDGDGTYTALPDNGFGSKGNSGDYVLGYYTVKPKFKTRADGTTNPGSIKNLSFTAFNDRRGLLKNGKGVDLTITADLQNYAAGANNADSGIPVDPRFKKRRLLTGFDFDVESIARDKDGSFWVGEEFGPYVLHFSADGTLLDEPIPHPFLKSPQHPDVLAGTAAANFGSSRGFESLAFDHERRYLYAVPEGAPTVDALRPVPGDDAVVGVYEIDPKKKRYTGRSFKYRKDGDATSNQIVIGDVTSVGKDVFVFIERDNFFGANAKLKKLYLVNLGVTDDQGVLVKHLLIDLLDIDDPKDIGGDLPGLAPKKYNFPFNSVEAVLLLEPNVLGVAIDTNYPGDTGRVPGRPDDTEFIKLEFEHDVADYAPRPAKKHEGGHHSKHDKGHHPKHDPGHHSKGKGGHK